MIPYFFFIFLIFDTGLYLFLTFTAILGPDFPSHIFNTSCFHDAPRCARVYSILHMAPKGIKSMTGLERRFGKFNICF